MAANPRGAIVVGVVTSPSTPIRLAIPTICAAWRTICDATSPGSGPRSTPRR